MSYNLLELTEAEEDFTGVAASNLISDESHDFETPDSRLFAPDLGQFYLNSKFRMVDKITGRVLVRDVDYEVEYFSKRVHKRSGLDNAYLIRIINESIKGILLTYQCVGGLYTAPAYLLQMMMDKYPDGLGPVVYWKNVLFKPDQFVPAGHRHHALEVYGLSPFNDSLERVRGTMTDADRVKFQAFYDNTLNRFQDLLNTINNGYNGIITNFQDTRKGLELQQGDFIYTDSDADQAVLRRYGKWKRHINTMLAAGGLGNAGTSMSVGKGYSNPVRQTNLYQRIDDPWGNAVDIVEKTLLLQASKTSFNEGETITIDIAAVNIPPGTMLTGNFTGIAADNIKNGNISWNATLDAFGKAQIKLETVANKRTTGNVDITVLPEQFATSAINLVMLDTSRTPVYDLYFSADAQGLNRINRVNEGSVMYLNLVVTNPVPNEVLTLNYNAGQATADDFVNTLPTSITIPTNGIIRTRLETKNDERAEGMEVFVAALLPNGGIDLALTMARAEVTIMDTSYQAEFNAGFYIDTNGNNRITEVSEGQTFYLYATTSLPNGTVVNLEYGGTTLPDDFTARPTTATVSGGMIIAAITPRSDARTDGDKIMGLTVKRTTGAVLANLSIVVRDTSQAPEGTVWFSAVNGGLTHVDSFNEGQTIFITLNTRNVENGTYLNLSYAMDGAITQADINNEFTAPLPTRVPITNNQAVIAATILKDYKADKDRKFTCTLTEVGVFADCMIRDTSVPIVTVRCSGAATGIGSISEANEGQTFYLAIDTKGYAAGSTLGLIYTGTATDADFTAALPTSVTVSSTGSMVIPLTVKNDFLSEGNETFAVTVRSGTANVASTSMVIRDTSLTPILNVLVSTSSTVQTAINNINEGVTAYVHMNWTNMPLNSNIDWSVVHVSTTAADFDKSSGRIVNTNYAGAGFDTITTKLDKTTENSETFRVQAKVTLSDGRVISVETGAITINDTSKTEEFNCYFSSDSAGNTTVTRINEGQAVYYIMKGSNMPDGTQFRLTLPSVGTGFVNDGDLSLSDGSVTGTTLTMSNNFASKRFTLNNDRLTEGDETLTIRATRIDTNIPRDASVIVTDTSKAMILTAKLILTTGAAPASNNFSEGQAGYLDITYSNATVGDILKPNFVTATGNVVAADFTSTDFDSQKTLTATSGTLRWNFTTKADRTTEGDRNFVVTIDNLTSAIKYPLDAAYKLLDTSKTTTYTNGGWYNAAGATISQANEGNATSLRVTPVDGVIGDVYRISFTGGTATLNSDFTLNTADIVYNTLGQVIQWPIQIVADRETEGNQTVSARITNVTTGQVCGTWTLTIADTSLTPGANLGFWTAPASAGGTLISTINEGAGAWFRLGLNNPVQGDKWRVSIAANSVAKASDISFVSATEQTVGSGTVALDFNFSVIADELTENNETLTLQAELMRAGASTWTVMGTANLTIVDTSKTPTFDIYYSNNASGTDRITSIGEGKTVYLICKTTNIASGTVLQVNFTGSTVNSADFTTAAPYAFPAALGTLVNMTVQSTGIAYYRFDIKADLTAG